MALPVQMQIVDFVVEEAKKCFDFDLLRKWKFLLRKDLTAD